MQTFFIKVVGSDAHHRLIFHEKGKLSRDVFLIIFFIAESPVFEIVLRDHVSIWSLVLGKLIGGRFQSDETVISVSVSQVIGITFFSGTENLECVYF